MMMKKELFLTALLFICCGVLQVKAQNMPKKHLRQVVIDNLTYEINKDDATARVLGFGKEKVYNLVIPSKIKYKKVDYPVLTIVDNAFSESRITDLVIGEGVKCIGNRAFYACRELTRVSLPGTIRFIGDEAFCACDKVFSYSLADSVSIGRGAFSFNWSLVEVRMPKVVSNIGARAFLACRTLREVTLPENVTHLADSVFKDCYDLASVTFPKSLVSIGNHAFRNCLSLRSFMCPPNLRKIGNCAFCACNGLMTFSLSDSLEEIGSGAFSGCKLQIKTLVIPPKIKEISKDAFARNNMEEVVIPEGVTSIGDRAFKECSQLKETNFPQNLKEIGEDIFYGCNSLKYVFARFNGMPSTKRYSFDGMPHAELILLNGGSAPFDESPIWRSFIIRVPIN